MKRIYLHVGFMGRAMSTDLTDSRSSFKFYAMDLFVISLLYGQILSAWQTEGVCKMSTCCLVLQIQCIWLTDTYMFLICPLRYALQDMDKFSLKDSGRGDSEAGDSDCDMGRESPVDRLLLGEGFSDLIHLEMHHRLHPGELLVMR